MHDIPFRPTEIANGIQRVPDIDTDAGGCDDLHPRCGEWTASGECQRNKGFMSGDSNSLGTCRKSCGTCDTCASGDMDCINRNRERGGYWKLNKNELQWLGAGDLWQEDQSPEL
jgi:prolyl 4-hydroxylase